MIVGRGTKSQRSRGNFVRGRAEKRHSTPVVFLLRRPAARVVVLDAYVEEVLHNLRSDFNADLDSVREEAAADIKLYMVGDQIGGMYNVQESQVLTRLG